MNTTTHVSYGQGALGRIYERLRKRSYRARILKGWVGRYSEVEHAAYIRGVRDALDEVLKGS